MSTVYAGMDFGWRSFRYEFRTSRNQVLERGGAPATPEALKQVLAKYASTGRVQVAFEAGTQMHWIDQVIQELGYDSYPFHAAHFQMTVKSKSKTDKKDAERMAVAAVKQNLPPRVYVPEGVERVLRESLMERASYQKELNAWGNRLHALAMGEGVDLGKRSLCQSLANWDTALAALAGTRREAAARQWYTRAVHQFQLLEANEEKLRALVSEGEMGEARRRLETIPGIGFWAATGILAWCGPRASRFATGRQAASYFGLTRSVYESGQIRRPGHITKTGPPLVRKWLTQAAWAFIRSAKGQASAWGRWQTKMTSRDKDRRKKATIALARRILTAAVACLRKETEWDPEVLKSRR